MAQEKENGPTTFHMSTDNVLGLLSEYGASGTLQTVLPSPLDAKRKCLVVLLLQKGKVISLQATTDNHHLLKEADIQRILRGGTFSWQFTYQNLNQSELSPSLAMPRQESPTRTGSSLLSQQEAGSISPKQQQRPDKVAFSSLQPERLRRLYMNFYALCDGMHTLEHIANLLNLPLTHAQEIMQSLAQLGYIDIPK